MPLRSEFKADPLLELGIGVPTLADQCAEQGLVLRDPDLWEERHKAWALLKLGGFLSDVESARIGNRLVEQIGLATGFDTTLIKMGVGPVTDKDEEPEELAADESSVGPAAAVAGVVADVLADYVGTLG